MYGEATNLKVGQQRGEADKVLLHECIVERVVGDAEQRERLKARDEACAFSRGLATREHRAGNAVWPGCALTPRAH